MKEKLYKISPHFLQNLFVTGYNVNSYSERYGGSYKKFLELFKKNRQLTIDELKNIQNSRFLDFLSYAIKKSEFYENLYKQIELPQSVVEIHKLPIVDKEMFRKNIQEVHTIDSKSAIHSKTGGTTGKSLEVYFTPNDMQERFAMLDDFRGRSGYSLGKKTAWFSGKTLLTEKDIRKNRFWKTDWYYKVRYYSTFHIKDDYLRYYLEDLLQFQPEYLVGFPSNILEIAKFGTRHGYKYPEGITKAIFPTAETITNEMRAVIEPFFKTKMYNQYASSEGAPFIFECEKGNLHLELQSGVFEVLDENNEPTNNGRLVVTSFTTYGTPLIRYDIGDNVELDKEICTCGNQNPLVKQIHGRIDDYVYSPETGKINLGNVSNTLKDTLGIVKFQVIQESLNEILIKLIVDNTEFTPKIEQKFLSNWRDRLGNEMSIRLEYVNDIPVEKSGKYRMVKNNIKHLIE